MSVRIQVISMYSPHLSAVKELWRANSTTLGFLPEGAFDDYAARGQILVALGSDENCIGYLIFYERTSTMEARLVHLCVDPQYRGQGVARALVEHLKRETRQYRAITLGCRRDYEAYEVWQRLDFVPIGEKLGRSGKHITEWRFDHGHPSLFKYADEQRIRSKLAVAVDACVFYDLQDKVDFGNEESKALLADWLQDAVELCLTDEIFSEIDRNKDPKERERQREYAQSFTRLHTEAQKVQERVEQLKPFFPEPMTRRDESDLHQLAHAIAAGVKFFVTRDSGLLGMVEEVYETFGISIVRPSDLIVHQDEFLREDEYQPARLAGSGVHIRLVQAEYIPLLVEVFQCPAQRETKSAFRRRLSGFLADPQMFETWIVLDAEHQFLALIVHGRPSERELEIPMLRVSRGRLSSTIARHLVFRSISTAAREKRTITTITDPYLSEDVILAAQRSGFVRITHCWTKVGLQVMESADELAVRLESLRAELGQETGEYLRKLSEALALASLREDTQALLDVEWSLWPAKIVDIDTPAFIVAIEPKWAMDLFDEELAKQTLWGADTELMLSSENVYYRARRPGVLHAPGRILWYVKQDEKVFGSKNLRAYSRLDEVLVGKPKDLYRRFRRLGVFTWQDVYERAHRDIDEEIMAFQFSATELFTAPIHWDDLQRILEEEGCKSQLRSPLRISSRCFERLYSLGRQMEVGRG